METLDNLLVDRMGLALPYQRFAFGFLASSGIIYAAKPSSMFNADGSPRPWDMPWGNSGAYPANGTMVPWWAPGVAVGAFISIFV